MIPHLASKLKSRNIWTPFGQKKTPKLTKYWMLTKYWQFSSFLPKSWSNLMRFQFWGQIWITPTILHILGLWLLLFSHWYFLTYYVIFKILQIARVVIFSKSFFLGQIRNQRPKRDNNGWCGERFAEKTWWSQSGLMNYWEFSGGGGMACSPHRKIYSRVSMLRISAIIFRKAFRRGENELSSR